MATQDTARFTDEASVHSLFPLWEMVTGHQIHEPRGEPAHIWRWDDAQRLIDRSVEETTTETAERRVLLMGNPAFGSGRARTQTSRTIQGAYQVLMPGESARPHRHTPNALRFILEDGGETYTIVDGKECLMQRGDILLTPANCWHAHVHRGSRRTVWFDALDSCMAAMFNAAFFEPAAKLGNFPETLPEGSYVHPGFSPVLPDGVPAAHSARFLYPWAESVAALAAAPARDDGSRRVRLTNPDGATMAMPPMDVHLAAIGREPTRAHRTTANAIVVAAQGAGTSRIGDQDIRWRQNDVFTLPQWQWVSHRAESDDAVLFEVTDRGALDALGYLRDEYR